MRVVVAPDSFKGTLTAEEAARAMAQGIRRAVPDAEVVERPMADGGEGTLTVLRAAIGGELRSVRTFDPLGRPIAAQYLVLPDGAAVIELAAASGLTHIPPEQRRSPEALRASTYGTGVVVRAALEVGARVVYLTLGGSATTDGGFGLLAALGAVMTDAAGRLLDGRDAANLGRVVQVDVSEVRRRLAGVSFILAVDVDNPLCGPSGAAAVYGPQKGLDAAAVARRDRELAGWARILRAAAGESRRLETLPGMGAAGGAGLPLRMLAGATVRSGADWAAGAVRLEETVAAADWVMTGEGRTDGQSALGKVPARVAAIASRWGKPCVIVSGALGPGHERLSELGVTAFYAATPQDARPDAIQQMAAKWLERAAYRAAAERRCVTIDGKSPATPDERAGGE